MQGDERWGREAGPVTNIRLLGTHTLPHTHKDLLQPAAMEHQGRTRHPRAISLLLVMKHLLRGAGPRSLVSVFRAHQAKVALMAATSFRNLLYMST